MITLTREEAQQVLDALEEFPYSEGIKTILRNKLIAPDVMINGLTEQETAETMSVKGLSAPEPSVEPIPYKVGDATVYIRPPIYNAPPQPEALSIAKRLKNQQQPLSLALRHKAAAKLRRLHEVNAELLSACQEAIRDYKQADCRDEMLLGWTEIMEKAIAKAVGEQQ
jgi:hypothetical protein